MAEYMPSRENLQSSDDQEEILLENDEAFHRAAGGAVIRALENAPSREKIYHPERKQSESRQATREYEADAKARDEEIAARRQFRREAKGDYNYSDQSIDKLRKKANEFGNYSLLEEDESTEAREKSESIEDRVDKLYNFYESNIDRYAQSWVSYGVSSLLEKSVVKPDNGALLRSGFWAREEDRVHERIDPDNTYSEEAIDAEMELRSKVSKELIAENADKLDSEALKKGKHDGLLYAISVGARRDEEKNKVIFSIPTDFNQGDIVIKSMRENDVNPDAQDVQLLSYDGFAGVVEAIKNDKRAKEKGFKTLDWYFDTFGYQKHMDEFTDTIQGYYDEDDKAFADTLNEFLSRRKETQEWERQKESINEEEIAALAEAKPISRNEFLELLVGSMQGTSGIEMFPIEDSNRIINLPRGAQSKKCPSSVEKCTKAKGQVQHILNIDPSASFALGTIFEREFRGRGKKQPKQDYAIIRFGYNDHNNVICIHIGDDSRAMFCWRGQTGDNPEGWRDYFKDSSIRTRDTAVRRFVCRGYAQHGTDAIDEEWGRIWGYLDGKETA